MKTIHVETEIDDLVERIYRYLQNTNDGDMVTYDELNQIVKMNVQGEARTVLNRSRDRLSKEGIFFQSVYGVGLKRLDDEIKATHGKTLMKKISRAVKRTNRVVSSVKNYHSLSPDGKIEHDLTKSLCGVFSLMTKPDKVLKIRNEISTVRETLPDNKTLLTIFS